ncbi:MAG: OmpA family protein [Actinomycetota bacterium]
MPSIVESVSKRLNRPDARARLADLAGVTPAAARKAIAPSSRAVIGALARAADQEGGARPVADLVAAVGSIHADDLIDRLANTSPYGDELVTALFGDERERVISVIGGKKAPDSDAGGILLGQLAPVVVSMVAERQAADGLDADALAVMIGEEAARSSGAGSAKLGVPALAGIVGVTGAAAAARTDMPPAADGVVTEDLPADAAAAVGTSPSSSSPSVGTAAAAAAAGAAAAASVAAGADGADSARVAEGAEGADGADGAEDTTVAAAATGAVAAAAAGASLPSPPPRVVPDTGRAPVVIDEDRGLLRSPLVALTGVVALAVAVAWLLTQVTTESVDTATSTSGRSGAAEQVAGPVADEEVDDADAADPAPEPEGPTETDGVAPSGESDDGVADDGASDDGASDDGAGSEGADGDDGADADAADGDADGGTAATETAADGAADAADEVDDADLVGRVARAVTATGVGDGVAVTSVNGEVTLGGSAADAAASQAIEDAVAAVDGVVSVTNDIRLIDDGAADEAAASADDAGAAADDGASTASDDSDGSDGADDGDKGEGSLNALLGLDTIRFEYYSEDLSSSGRSELDQVVGYLDDNADVSLEIQGHTDAIGAASLNQRLGQRRADAVRAYLIEAGIDGDRLTAVGIGEVDPVASNDTEAGREANRRIEFVIG